MRRSGKGSGGGLGMNKNTERPVRVGPGAKGVNKQWVSQIGQSMGNHITEKSESLRGVRADGPYKPPNFNPVPQGNEVAASTVCGVGGSRTVYRSGAQHGMRSPSPPAKNRSID